MPPYTETVTACSIRKSVGTDPGCVVPLAAAREVVRWLTCMKAIPWERSSDGESSISLCRMKAGQSLYSWGNRPCTYR